jgi:hypothetical protein
MANTLKAKYLLIEKTRISKPAQEVLNDIKEATKNFKQVSPALRKEFNNFYDRLKSAKPEAIKGTKEYKEYKEGSGSRNATPEPSKALKEALAKARENRKSQGLRTDSESIHRDSKRPALKPGKRKSKEGNIYYEYRENRIDRRPSRFPKLGEGGGVGQRSMFDDHMTEEHRADSFRSGGGVGEKEREKLKALFILDAERIADDAARQVNKTQFTDEQKKAMPYYKRYLLELVIQELEEKV